MNLLYKEENLLAEDKAIWGYSGPHCTLEIVLLAEERYVATVSKDELKASLGKEAAKISTEHSLKESPHWNNMILAVSPVVHEGIEMWLRALIARKILPGSHV